MTRNLLRLLLGAGMCLYFLSAAHACLPRVPKYKVFNPEEYVFYGKVIGYVQTPGWYCGISGEMLCPDGWGLRLAVTDMVSMPNPAIKEVDVFTFGLGADCSEKGMSREWVGGAPLGAQFMVVAKRWQGSSTSGVIRLDASDYKGNILAPLPLNADTAALSRAEMSYIAHPDSRDAEQRIRFELRKDLTRLEKDNSPEARKRTLARLAGAGWFGDSTPDSPDQAYTAAVRKYVSDEQTARWLLEKRRVQLHEN